MIAQIFGNFLVSINCITQEQFDNIIETESKIRVRLGLLAVNEKIMTTEQADEVNRLQSMVDKLFGEIAIEKGYMTKEQLGMLLASQQNNYLAFIQALIDGEVMTMQGIDVAMSVFQKVSRYSSLEMEILKSNETDGIVKIFTKNVGNKYYQRLIGVMLRTCIRIIDSNVYIDEAFQTDYFVADYFAEQRVKGDFNFILAFCGKDNNLLPIANQFADENDTEVNNDVLDAVCEFINCVNGMFVTTLSYENVDLDMDPPLYSCTETKRYEGKPIYVIPMHIKGELIHLAIVTE